MEEWRETPESSECYVFCSKHLTIGKQALKLFGAAGLEG
jgi:hypothetical protein